MHRTCPILHVQMDVYIYIYIYIYMRACGYATAMYDIEHAHACNVYTCIHMQVSLAFFFFFAS